MFVSAATYILVQHPSAPGVATIKKKKRWPGLCRTAALFGIPRVGFKVRKSMPDTAWVPQPNRVGNRIKTKKVDRKETGLASCGVGFTINGRSMR